MADQDNKQNNSGIDPLDVLGKMAEEQEAQRQRNQAQDADAPSLSPELLASEKDQWDEMIQKRRKRAALDEEQQKRIKDYFEKFGFQVEMVPQKDGKDAHIAGSIKGESFRIDQYGIHIGNDPSPDVIAVMMDYIRAHPGEWKNSCFVNPRMSEAAKYATWLNARNGNPPITIMNFEIERITAFEGKLARDMATAEAAARNKAANATVGGVGPTDTGAKDAGNKNGGTKDDKSKADDTRNNGAGNDAADRKGNTDSARSDAVLATLAAAIAALTRVLTDKTLADQNAARPGPGPQAAGGGPVQGESDQKARDRLTADRKDLEAREAAHAAEVAAYKALMEDVRAKLVEVDKTAAEQLAAARAQLAEAKDHLDAAKAEAAAIRAAAEKDAAARLAATDAEIARRQVAADEAARKAPGGRRQSAARAASTAKADPKITGLADEPNPVDDALADIVKARAENRARIIKLSSFAETAIDNLQIDIYDADRMSDPAKKAAAFLAARENFVKDCAAYRTGGKIEPRQTKGIALQGPDVETRARAVADAHGRNASRQIYTRANAYDVALRGFIEATGDTKADPAVQAERIFTAARTLFENHKAFLDKVAPSASGPRRPLAKSAADWRRIQNAFGGTPAS